MVRSIYLLVALVALVMLAACGPPNRGGEDGGPPGDATIGLPPTPSRELVGGAGRLTGKTFTLDVQIGHPVNQQPTTGAKHRLEGNAAVKP